MRAGSINKKMGFIQNGLLRYYVNKDGDDGTIDFCKEGVFVAEYESFINGSPSIQNIQAIEDTTILVINSEDLLELYNTTPNGNLIGRVVIEYRFNTLVRQLLSIYMHNPQQRYENFINSYPNLIQRLPQYCIASYVGVKPESLSRIRKRMTESNPN